MDTQVRTAKAVVDIDEVHFFKHNPAEPTITESFLNDANSDWFSVATLKGSVEVAQDELSKTMIHIDQSSLPIGISTEPGDFNVTFNMPSLLSNNLEVWLKNKTASPIAIGTKQGYGYNFTEELYNMVLAIKTKTLEWFIFPNIQGAVTMAKEDNVWILKYTGAVLAASNDQNKDVYILADAKTTV